MNLPRRFVRTLSSALLLAGSVSACAPVIVGTAAVTTAVVAYDRRTAGEHLDDEAIEFKVASAVRKSIPDGDTRRVNSTAYGGVVLLTGDVATHEDRQRAENAAAQVEKVQRVVNRLRVGDITSLGVRSNDTWITTKVRTNLIDTTGVPSSSILITTERGTVYLMGRVTREEAERAARVAANISEVNQVVTLFDVVPIDRITPPAPAPQTPPPAPVSSSNAQTMPVR